MNVIPNTASVYTLDLHRKMRAVQEFWNSTQIQKGKKKNENKSENIFRTSGGQMYADCYPE